MEKNIVSILGKFNLRWPKACWSTVLTQEQNTCYIKTWQQRWQSDVDWLCFDIELGAFAARWTR